YSLNHLLTATLIPLVSNLVAVVTPEQFIAEICYLFYLVGLNLFAYMLLAFIMDFCEIKYRGSRQKTLITLLVLVNTASLCLNPFFHHVFVVKPDYFPNGDLFFVVESNFGRYLNFAVVVFVVCISIQVLIVRMRRLATVYYRKYLIITAVLVIDVLLEFYFMFSDAPVDHTISAYTILGIILYYFTLIYKPTRIARNLADAVVKNHTDGIIFYDYDVNALYANDEAYKILDLENKKPDACTDKLIDITGGADLTTDFDISARFNTREDETRYVNISHRLMKDKKGLSIGSFFNIHDNTDEILLNEKRRWEATHDSLTGIYNRNRFLEKVGDILTAAPDEDYLMVAFDINDFKFINEVYGKDKADSILILISKTIASASPKDAVYCRWSGDIFAVFTKKSNFGTEENVIRRNIRGLETKFRSMMDEQNDTKQPIVIHVGVYETSDLENIRPAIMIDRCQIAIETIKGDFNNRLVFYDNKIRENRLWEQRITTELDAAIRNGEIVPYIQPQYNADGVLEGGEILARWIHSEHGFLAPFKFIPTFEKNGMIYKLDLCMWENACKILSRWKHEGRDWALSVNISPKDFYFLDIYGVITELVSSYRIDPAKLHLEITESAVIDNAQDNIEVLRKLREAGFIVEMDDFGSGYSSLNMLKEIPLDVLKIDMVFLKESANYDKSSIILQSIIDMANKLNLSQITEGVETREQLNMLKEMGCKLFQGYYFSKPIPIDEFEKLPPKI
ncbi:MAG: EAL domain-containing protein, partial [Clostridiales bacterium]|nr:EAL domain-containing protein [Clostridiales bacterium]